MKISPRRPFTPFAYFLRTHHERSLTVRRRGGSRRAEPAPFDGGDGAERPPPDSFTPGEVVAGKYALERVLGVGGVGVVLAARHAGLDERVAIKFLHPEMQRRHDIVRRFAAEARAAVRIKSEYAARVYDVGTCPKRGPYLVMESLKGKDLADVLAERGPLPAERFQNVAEFAISPLPFGPSWASVSAERTNTIVRASGQTVGVMLKVPGSAPSPTATR